MDALQLAARALSVSAALRLLAIANGLAFLSQLPGAAAFWILLGGTLALLTPALQAASADWVQGPVAGQATALVGSAQPLASILSGPILALTALLAGWWGAFLALALAALVVAQTCALTLDWQGPQAVARYGYRQAFIIVSRAPGAASLLVVSTVQRYLWYTWLTYLAAYFVERFDGTTVIIAWVWFIGAGTFFLAHLVSGRLVNPPKGVEPSPWRSPAPLLAVTTAAQVVLAPLVFMAPTVPAALCATVASTAFMGASQAAVTSLLIRTMPRFGARS
jgi:predicted MFS family arabinose efflux permease